MHAARIARLEELLVRVRANAALGPSLRTRAFIEPEPVVDPTIDEEIEEIDRAALKQSLERHIEVALGDPGPAVPFPEELEGWEPDPLELERDDGPRLLNRRDADIDLVDVAIPSAPRAPAIVEPIAEPDRPSPEPARPSPDPVRAAEPKPAEEEPEPSELGRVLEEAARARGEIDPRAIWDGLAGQLRGRRPSGVRAAAAASAPASPSNDPPTSVEPAPEPAPVSVPKAAPSSRRQRAAGPSSDGGAPSRPILGLDFDDGARAPAPPPASGGLADVSPITRPSRSRSAEAAKRRSRPSAPDLVVALDQVAELGASDDVDEARPSRKRWARAPRRRLARPSSSNRTKWLLLGVGAAVVGAVIALAVIAPWKNPDALSSVSAVASDTAPRPRASTGPTSAPRQPTPPVRASSPEPSATTPPRVVSPTLPQPGAPPVTDLGEAEGWLLVDSTAPLAVYLNGNLAGSVGEWIRTPCGVHFLRLAKKDPPRPGASFPTWLDEGDSLVIPCRGSTAVTAPAIP